jgi:lambda family phage tail tape measure protein
MADLRYSAEVDTRGAVRSLDNLKNTAIALGAAIGGALAFREIAGTASRFEDLRVTLQLLYKDTAIGAAAFDDIKKFAETSVFSVQDLTETIVKLKAAGLEPTVQLLQLFADTSAVAADKVGALQAITDLYARTTAGGLGLEDLNRLADRGIPVFTILSERLGLSRLEISKVGQSAEGARIILKALEDGLQDAFGGASAARANNVSQAMSNFGDAVDNAADAIGQAGLNQGVQLLIKSMTELLSAITPALEIFGRFAGVILTELAENLKLITSLAAGFFAAFVVGRVVALASAFLSLAKAINITNLVIGKGPIGLLQKGLIAAGAAMGLLGASSIDLSGEIDKLSGETDKLANGNGFKVLQDGKLGAGTENLRESIKAVNVELNKFKVEMDGVVAAFARYNESTVRSLQTDTDLIGASREIAALRRSEMDINRRLQEEIARLTEQKAKLTEEEKKQGRAGVIDATIKKLEEQAAADKRSAEAAIQANEAKQRSDSLRLFNIESQIDAQRDLRKIQDDIAKSTMSAIERKEYDILASARERALTEIRAEEVRRGSLLTDAEKLKYYEAAKQGTQELIAAEKIAYEQSRQFSTGWTNAFRQYVDEATNAAKAAERIFQKATQGMEDLIVNFAKTGKFEFKSFVNSMLEELLRSQVRQMMAQIFNIGSMGGASGSGGGGGLLSSIGNLLGFANGGVIPTNKPVLVGERGPEIISGASGRVVTPNSQIGLGTTNVVYNISAVDARSFKDLVAQDPSFIYAITQQGAKGIPGRR